jgi:predicted heme/steroid binding protein
MKLCDITDKKPAKLDKDGWLGVYVFVTTDGKIYSVSEARVYMLGTYQDLIVHGHLQSKDCWCSYVKRDHPDFWTSGVPMGRIYEH